MLNTKRIGLALGSGSVKGIAHIGVIKVLLEHNIPIHCIAGSSAGAVVGALYCSGANWDMLERFVCHIKSKNILDYSLPKKGLVEGKKAHELLRMLTKDATFDQLPIPLAVAATDLERGEQVVINSGKVADAVRASISIPGVFKPVTLEGKLLVDGAILDRVPVEMARAMGAELVIAVDVKGRKVSKKAEDYNIIDVIMNSIDLLESKAFANCCARADVVIFPDVIDVGNFNFDMAEDYIAAGAQATKEQLPKIIELMKKN